MVTFVSQCEKKSLAKTRRVLDAFANRIGSNTWQTVITQEGLDAVQSLLRRTASKNTAVSCHWLRSRSRSELRWIVGHRGKFNPQGIVPVNYTTQENILNRDEIEMNSQTNYANTQKQPLDQHLFAVGYVAYRLIKQFVDDDKLAKVAFVAGCLHDIGKIDPAFQAWVLEMMKKKIESTEEDGQHIDKSGPFSFENHPRHNELSTLLYHLLNDPQNKSINQQNKNRIKHVLYWHHAKPLRKEEFKTLDVVYTKLKKSLGKADFSEITDVFHHLIQGVNQLSKTYVEEAPLCVEGFLDKADEDRIDDLDQTDFPHYKRYRSGHEDLEDYLGDIQENAKSNLARTAVITADRLVSALSSEALEGHLEENTLHLLAEQKQLPERGLKQEIQACLDGFQQRFPGSERNQKQSKAALALSKGDEEENAVKLLSGAAGCGKTKIALEWAKNRDVKKIIWICPRVQVCQGLVSDLTSPEYLPHAKIEIYTGEFKKIYQAGQETETPAGNEFSGDIVLTTIDQVINTITTHSRVTGLVEYMNAHVVFDEFHEYIHMPAFNLLFAELVECKKMQKDQAKALLVSATPNLCFVEGLLELEQEDTVTMGSFNERQYKIQFSNFDETKQDESNPLHQVQAKNIFVISNTATTAQLSFITHQDHEKAILFHSKYKKSDKQHLFNQVFESFKRGGSKQYEVLRAGPIVQASLNITCDQMITEFTHAENWLQRLGRLDRFGQNDEVNLYITAVPESIAKTGKQTGACARFLSRMDSFQSAKAWHDFILNQDVESKNMTIADIYRLYQDFYHNAKSRAAVEQDLVAALKKSVEMILNRVVDPVSFPKKKKNDDKNKKIKKSSLRGDNRFVQMAVCQVTEPGHLEFPEEYAYAESEVDESLTTSVELICGYGDSKQDLLAYMVKKHHSIKEVKQSYKDRFTLNEARNPEKPIYLSYTPHDLAKIGGESVRHDHAIYYALGKDQAIGIIPINQLSPPKGEKS